MRQFQLRSEDFSSPDSVRAFFDLDAIVSLSEVRQSIGLSDDFRILYSMTLTDGSSRFLTEAAFSRVLATWKESA